MNKKINLIKLLCSRGLIQSRIDIIKLETHLQCRARHWRKVRIGRRRMVLAEKNHEETRNGRRSRVTSPNGHLSDDGSATDDSERDDNGMRVGADFQAAIPELVANSENYADYSPERALLVWLPSGEIPETKLDEFVTIAKEKFGYNAEQALGMLFWHKHDLEKAIADLPNFTPFPDDWSVEDKVLFEQAFQFHGKSFHRIRQMLPDKTIASLVKYYYSWKKTRSRTSLMDRQARKLATQREEGSEVGSEVGSNSESDFEDNKGENKSENNSGGTKSNCSNCNLSVSHTHSTPKGNLCNICYQYWRLGRTGMARPASGQTKNIDSKHDHRYNSIKSKRKPPRGMYLSYDDLLTVATGPPGQGDAILKAMDSEIVSLKRQVQNSKQIISALKHKTSGGIEDYRPPEANTRIVARWTNEELLLAVQGVRKYGKDFKAIAEVIGNKTEGHIRSFFVNYRRRYNLDAVLEEYEAENGPIPEEDKEEKMEVDSNSSKSNSTTPTPPVLVTSSGSAPPPPLLKPVQTSNINSKPPPLQQSARIPITRTTPQQQPPPLIRPNAVPIMAPKSQPPQLTSRNS
uniref:REST corepressor n=1 Tax=Strigamia maritima TaxID=126957 RepID=T1IQN0_STRMM